MMCANQILLKGGHARELVDETPDTRIILRDGLVIKSHRLILSSNSFLHQLLCSSWVAGEISTFLMPQHSLEDFLLNFSLPVNTFTNGPDALYDSNNETGSDAGKIKVEEMSDAKMASEDYTIDHHPDTDEELEVVEEAGGELANENNFLSKFEPILKKNSSPAFEKMIKQVETVRKRLQSESKTPFGKKRKKISREVYNKQSSDIAEGDDHISDRLGHSDNSEEIVDITLAENVASDDPGSSVKSESELHPKNEETRLTKNLSTSTPGRTIFPVKKGKKGMMFTKEGEHEWHLLKLNSSNPKVESDYYHCSRSST